MKTWKKVTIALVIILILLVGWLYFRSASTTDPESDDRLENPIFPFEPSSGDNFFGGREETPDEEDDSQPTTSSQPLLWQVSSDPIAGAGWVNTNSGTEIWFVSRANGHIYNVDPESRKETRITNTTIPQVREALISSTGKYVIYRYLDAEGQIKTYAANLNSSNDGEVSFRVSGSFLPNNITSINLSPAGDQLFYLQPTNSGVVGVIYTLETKNVEIVFESAASEWQSSWTSTEAVTLYTAADIGSTGFVYQISTNGSLKKIGEGRGVTANVSPENVYLLSSQLEGDNYRAHLEKLDGGTTLMSPPTLSEKCGWAVEDVEVFFCGVPNSIPDNPLKDWYQGRFNFDDTLVFYNPNLREQVNLFSEDQRNKGPFDITEIKTDDDFSTVIFTNKRDGSLWGFRL